MVRNVLARRLGTNWISVLGGWIATIGAAALVAPAVVAVLARTGSEVDDVGLALPALIGIFMS